MIRFSCKVTGAVAMLDAHAEVLLQAIGKPLAERGVITPEQIPAALHDLQTAIAGDEQAAAARAAAEREEHPDEVPELERQQEQRVGLGQRAFPFIQMLQRAQAAEVPILWER